MYQNLTIVGNLGRDPELRFLPSGQAVTTLNVATNNTYVNSNGERVKETTWFRVSVWGSQAENCNKYLQRGSKVMIEGRLKPDPSTGSPRIWTRQDGTSGTSFEVTASRVIFLTSRDDDQQFQGQNNFSDGDAEEYGSSDMMDDIPF
ncbi:MAG: single-stranded DNA-binding protein [Anaerolineales bacterium]|nr:single-stranded DNA-binding protein [Anaerolineales bacterium]